jgi:hypothetical protein
MSEASVETLFDEFAIAYARGERPDLGTYLERAAEGAERDDLAGLIDRFLQAMPARESSEEEVVLMQARLESAPPLLLLRVRRAVTREAIVDALVGQLSLDPEKRDKVGRYYHELETGLLDPTPVDRSVWSVLADVLKANTERLADLRPSLPAPAGTVYLRSQDVLELAAPAGVEAPVTGEERDEIDRLFTGGP